MIVGKTPSVPLKGEAMGVMYVRNIGVGACGAGILVKKKLKRQCNQSVAFFAGRQFYGLG